jgi:chromosome segregation ATPase
MPPKHAAVVSGSDADRQPADIQPSKKARIDDFEACLAAVEEENKRLRREVAELLQQASTAKTSEMELRRQLEEEKLAKETLQRELAQMHHDVKAKPEAKHAEGSSEQLLKANQTLTEAQLVVSKQFEHANTRASNAKADAAQCRNTIVKLRESLEETTKKAKEDVSKLQSAVLEAHSMYEKLDGRYNQLCDRVEQLDDELIAAGL